MKLTTYEVRRCLAELAAAEAELRAGNPDTHGLLLAILDWNAELRLIECRS